MNETMTIKELAEVAGCYEKTAKKYVAEAFPGLMQKGKTTRLNKEQAFDIMAKLPKRNNLGNDLGKNSQVAINREDIAAIVAETIKQLIPYLQISANNETPKQQLSLPVLNPRVEIRRLVNRYSDETQTPHGKIWNQLYEESFYRMKKNFKLLAANRGAEILTVIEEEGYIDQFLDMTKVMLAV